MNITDLHPASEQQKAMSIINAMSLGMRASSRIETMITATGDQIAVETTVTRGLWKSAPAVFSVSRDMSSQLQSEEQLKALLMNDALTGLYNLRGFAALAGQQLKTAYRAHLSAAVIFAHVDTETIPPAARPEILHAFASCLSETFRDSDMAARIGKTRFAVLAIQTDGSKLELLVQRLRGAVEHFNAGRSSGPELKVKIAAVRAGVPGLMSVDDLLKHADREMGPGESDPKD
jgi:diguanylate cyclase (GGDEF)-like protein